MIYYESDPASKCGTGPHMLSVLDTAGCRALQGCRLARPVRCARLLKHNHHFGTSSSHRLLSSLHPHHSAAAAVADLRLAVEENNANLADVNKALNAANRLEVGRDRATLWRASVWSPHPPTPNPHSPGVSVAGRLVLSPRQPRPGGGRCGRVGPRVLNIS